MKEECIICFELTRTHIDCGHAIHKKCLSKTLETFGENGMIIPWRCPVPDCGKKYNPYGLLKMEKIFSHIEKLKSFLGEIQDKRQIVSEISQKGKYLLLPCEDNSCKGLFSVGGKYKAKCYICDKQYCKKCFINHEGECEEEAVLKIEERKKTEKNCPRCGVCIEKNKGCDHMTCGICRYEFWWTNLLPYKEEEENRPFVHMERKTKRGQNVGSSRDISCIECENVCSNLKSRMCCYCIDKKSDFEKVRKFINGKFVYTESSEYYCDMCKENHFS